LFDATEYVRKAYEATSTYTPLAISTNLAQWEDVRRDLYASPESLRAALQDARAVIETGSLGEAERRERLLIRFATLHIFSLPAAEDLIPSV
jgi:hypothetical protein